MRGDEEGNMLKRALNRLVFQVRNHWWSLAAMSIAYNFAQICTLVQTPLASLNGDSHSYVQVADHVSQSFLPALIDPYRTPGYPLFLLLVQRITGTAFANMYCLPADPNVAVCNQAFIPFVFAQAAVYGITVLEIYVLAFWVTRKRWMAAVAAILTTCNLYMYSWEREIGTELLSFWALVTVMLIFVRYMRRPTLWWGGVLGLALFASVMIRPFNEFLPVLLAALALGRALWAQGRQGLRIYWKSALGMLLVVYGLLFAYIQLNGRINGVSDISFATNQNLFVKVYEYRMQDEPVPPQFATIQAESSAYIAAHGGIAPWDYFYELMAQHKMSTSPTYHYQDYGDFSRYIILHHPGTFVLRTIPDIFRAWIITDYQLYPDYGFGRTYPQPAGGLPYLEPGISAYPTLEGTVPAAAQPAWVNAWLILSTLEELSFGLLPLVLLGSLFWLWKHRTSEMTFYVLALAALSLLTILVAAFGLSGSWERLRFPGEWAMYLANTLVGLYLFDALLLRPAKQRNTRTDVTEQETAPMLTLPGRPGAAQASGGAGIASGGSGTLAT
jgi:hypothetical protein